MQAAALLGLMRLASPALPVGGFSYSDVLEAAVEATLVHDEPSALLWLRDQLHLSLARADLPLVAAAHAAWSQHDAPRITELNTWMLSHPRVARTARADRTDGPLDARVAAPANAR